MVTCTEGRARRRQQLCAAGTTAWGVPDRAVDGAGRHGASGWLPWSSTMYLGMVAYLISTMFGHFTCRPQRCIWSLVISYTAKRGQTLPKSTKWKEKENLKEQISVQITEKTDQSDLIVLITPVIAQNSNENYKLHKPSIFNLQVKCVNCMVAAHTRDIVCCRIMEKEKAVLTNLKTNKLQKSHVACMHLRFAHLSTPLLQPDWHIDASPPSTSPSSGPF